MLIDRGKLKAGMHMLLRPKEASMMKKNGPRGPPPPPNYVRIDLGSTLRQHGQPIREWVHRFICSAINGPPDEASGLTDVIHTCPRPHDDHGLRFGNPGCLNPLHMVFGKRDDNCLQGFAAQVRFQRLRELAAARRGEVP